MAIKIIFDSARNPEPPTIILARKNGDKLGLIDAHNIEITDNLNDVSEMSFNVYKEIDGKRYALWDEIVDFKLAYCVEWDMWFEIFVEVDESNESIKTVTCRGLGESELSQVNLYNIEINTEEDIARDEYKDPTVLYNPEKPEASLLHRIMEKASHYKVKHVDSSIASIQRMFSFDETSLYDAFQEIAEEIHCLFDVDVRSDENGNIDRAISVYDLEASCLDCGYRGEFMDKCPKCNSTNIYEGYGNDTRIFVDSGNLAESINFSVDTDSIKNCFKLEAGDDLMTATIRNCNPNGTDYIWYITDDMRHEMSDELVSRLDEYDERYEYYQNDYIALSSVDIIVSKYNALVDKYRAYDEDLPKITVPIKGYKNLNNAYYDTIDFEAYLRNTLMPNVEMQDTTAEQEAAKLTTDALSPVANERIDTLSKTTADSVVLSMAKIVADSTRYKITVINSTLSDIIVSGSNAYREWNGSFKVTAYADEEDTASTGTIRVEINEDYQLFIKQKIDKALAKNDVDNMDISSIFDVELPDPDNPNLQDDMFNKFVNEMKKYCLNRLTSFRDACQTCIDILIEQGVGDKDEWINHTPNIYDNLYKEYLRRLNAIEAEIVLRESELETIAGSLDENGDVKVKGIQNYIEEEITNIRNALDFYDFLGDTLWVEFCAFRREDKYSNDNYISDGLNNRELFEKAQEFLDTAEKEIYKSAEMQHTISADLHNMLVMPEFSTLVSEFEVGNWIRVMVDDKIFKLRLIGYTIDYSDLSGMSVEFSDITKVKNSVSDIKSVLGQASSISSSYGYVKRQAQQGSSGKSMLDNWAVNGMSVMETKVVSNPDNPNVTWDQHGILCREYNDELGEYDSHQLKIINKGLYVTNDNWETCKAGVGTFFMKNPRTGVLEKKYGVIADTLVGDIILGRNVGIYNENNNIALDEEGITVTINDVEDEEVVYSNAFTIQRKRLDGSIDKMMYVDPDGNLVLSGQVIVNTESSGRDTSLGDITAPSDISAIIDNAIDANNVIINQTIDTKVNSVKTDLQGQINNHKTEIAKYLTFGSNSVSMTAPGSNYNTLIDANKLSLRQGSTDIVYVSDSKLHIADTIVDGSIGIGGYSILKGQSDTASIVWNKGTQKTLIYLGTNGNSIGIGKSSAQDGMVECDMPINLTKDFTTSGKITVGKEAVLNGAATIAGALTANGTATFAKDITASAKLSVTGEMRMNGNVYIGNVTLEQYIKDIIDSAASSGQ